MRGRLCLLLALGLLISQPVVAADDSSREQAGPALTAMSLNLYVGLDVNSVFGARDLESFQAAAAAGWTNVQATDFHERAATLARLIEERDVDIIGLQEAMLWKTGPLGNSAPARTVAYDYIRILIDALAARGLQYEVAEEIRNLDFEAPVVAAGLDLRAIDRDALLVRNRPGNSKLDVVHSQKGTFTTALAIPFVTGPLRLPRGWVAIDIQHRGQTVRVVNTHLEALAPPIRDAQAAELLAGPLAGNGPAILIGDLNAQPSGSAPGAYGLLQSAGLEDAWTAASPASAGPTCCHAPTLREPSSLSTRIDYVLFRQGSGTAISAVAAELSGHTPAHQTQSGMWPSDHAGVSADLRIKGGH